MNIHRFLRSSGLLLLFAAMSIPDNAAAQRTPIASPILEGLEFRQIGPAVTGGRIHDVESLPNDPSTVFVATASGGIWKSTNKGTTWISVFQNQAVSTFGDLAISPSNPSIIWAGTGEQQNRQSTSWGNGVYRSVDGGMTWEHKGLVETRHIGRVLVDPHNPDIVFVAALGNLWKESETRGVFKTMDGGDSWERVLYIDKFTGAVDLVMDPTDGNTLYAATYQRMRRTWGFNGGGRGSGIYKTTNGGETWTEMTEGIPKGDKGRIGLALAESNPRVIYAIIEHADDSGIYRTSDAGESWKKVNTLNVRPMYYSHITVDPLDENRVYSLATEFYRSDDGGATFRQMPTRPTYDVGIHSDHHTMWIDPTDTEHFYLAGDAGLHETWDRGETYLRINNLPIGQFYAVGVDMRSPYHIFGGMQDNHSWEGPSATRRWIGILNDDWNQIGFGDGMYHQPDPESEFVYSNAQNGGITRLHSGTGDLLDIRPFPPEGEKPYRFDWVNPVVLSRHDLRTVYVGGNRLFISKDRGVSWERTVDLSRQIERDSLFIMGVQGKDIRISKNDGTSSYGEITTVAESPIDPLILWVGTDDGNVQVSRDGGMTWTEVSGNVDGLPNGTYVSRVVASVAAPGSAYATFDAHRDGDWKPYVFKTGDFGASWTRITHGLPEDGSVNVLIEHPDNPRLLFLGTEHALFVSFSGGQNWVAFRANLPTTLYDDLVIHPRENDLIVGTHGRSLWILDDISALSEWMPDAKTPVQLFSIRDATIFQYWKATSYRGQGAYAAENPDFGAYLTYYTAARVDTVLLTVRNAAGDIVRQLGGPSGAGMFHRVAWDLRHEPPPYEETRTDREGLVLSDTILPVLPHSTTPLGPFVTPDVYTVTLETGGATVVQNVRVTADPELEIPDTDWATREAFLLELLDKQRDAWKNSKEADAHRDALTAYRDSLRQQDPQQADLLAGAEARADSAAARSRRMRSIRSGLYSLAGTLNGGGVRQASLFPPTATHRDRKQVLEERLHAIKMELSELKAWYEDIPQQY